MNYAKKLLVTTTALIITMQTNTENLPGRTRNLNIFSYDKQVWLRSFASENDSNNILRDLACNCDNQDFELNVQLTLKPFALLNKLGHFENREDLIQKIQDLKRLINSPLGEVFFAAYIEKLSDQFHHATQDFIDSNLTEMLFSPDQYGKTVLDILQEKQSTKKVGCIMMKEMCQALERDIAERAQQRTEKKEVEESINKMIQ